MAAYDVDRAWDRIDGWLEVHAPRTRAALNSPAREQDLRALEQALGFDLPEDLRAHWLRHDGSAGEPSTDGAAVFEVQAIYQLSSVPESLHTAREMIDIARSGGDLDVDQDDVPEPDRLYWWHPGWVPYADSHAGSVLFVDAAGPRPGMLGRSDRDNHGGHTHASVAAFLEQTADALERRLPDQLWSAMPVAVDGALRWAQLPLRFTGPEWLSGPLRSPGEELVLEVNEPRLLLLDPDVCYHEDLPRDLHSPALQIGPEQLAASGDGFVVLRHAGSQHRVQVHLELTSSAPPPPADRDGLDHVVTGLELSQGKLVASDYLSLEGSGFQLPAPGWWNVAVTRAVDPGPDDRYLSQRQREAGVAPTSEHWHLQLWQ